MVAAEFFAFNNSSSRVETFPIGAQDEWGRGGEGEEVATLHEIILVVDVVIILLQGDVSLLQIVIEFLSLGFLAIEILRGHSGSMRWISR